MLEAGHRVGPYVVESQLGSGGMGEVYLAHDERLKRRVALKVLAGGNATQGSERLLREARAAARLDHVNICTIFDTGEENGQAYIAMQYVEGESLASRLRRRPTDLREALNLATQAASALAEAHRQGLVHRDVKPENVMITTTGHVKVLDFGLAQLTGPVADAATTVQRLTEAGAVAGTVRYMSPEQLKGELVDERSDVFSLGVVLYQMVGHAHPFEAPTAAETIAAILTRNPPPLSSAIPDDVRRLVGKCLEKDRDRRYQTARDLAVDLENAARTIGAPAAPPGNRRWPWAAAGAAALVTIGFAGWMMMQRQSPVSGPADLIQITDFADSAVAPAISPDGRMVAFLRGSNPFLTQSQIYVKLLPTGDAKQLTNDPRGKYGLAFSPDGTQLAYTTAGEGGWQTWTVPVLGGEPTRLLPNSAGLSWIGGGQLLFSEIKGTGLHMGVVTATETRANRREIYFPEHERAMAHYSMLSPDRQSVLVVQMSRTGGWESCRVVPFDGSNSGREVGPPGACRSAAWSPDGQWMYLTVDDGAVSHLWRQRFPNGAPEPITAGPTSDEQGVAIAPDGRWLITSIGRRSSSLWWHDAKGERQLTSEGVAWAPQLSPDATKVFFLVQRASSPQTRLAILDITTGRTEVLFPDVVIDHFHVAPDGRSVLYVTQSPKGEPEIWLASLDRSTAPRLVVERGTSAHFAGADTVVFQTAEGNANYIERIGVDGTGRERLRQDPIVHLNGMSPDGRWAIVVEGSKGAEAGRNPARSVAMALDGSTTLPLCFGPCRVQWTTDLRHIFIVYFMEGRTLRAPVPSGRIFPLAVGVDEAISVWEKLPGAEWLSITNLAPGTGPETYVFTRREELRNLFRIPIR